MRVKRTSSFTKTLPPEDSTEPQSPPKQQPLLKSEVKSMSMSRKDSLGKHLIR
jgi:hypothetical protein